MNINLKFSLNLHLEVVIAMAMETGFNIQVKREHGQQVLPRNKHKIIMKK